MSIFKLPDLGEGLPEAEIHEWYIKEGDHVTLDQPLVAMETAKAVVDVPSPQTGLIEHLYGQIGDLIKTGMPLIRFANANHPPSDQGTVVGHLEEALDIEADQFTIGTTTSPCVKATPKIKLLAKKANVDWRTLSPSGENGLVTEQDLLAAIQKNNTLPDGFEPLRGVRRSMLNNMVLSHAEVVPVTIYDEVNISQWYHPDQKQDITLATLRAICFACEKEPALNAWFNTQHAARRLFEEVNIGLAMDSQEGLFVPVLQDVNRLSNTLIREKINQLKEGVRLRSLPAEAFQNATITLSNFGKFAGRFASPIIVPPTVAIIAIGRTFEGIKRIDDDIKTQFFLPLSLSFDHRAITGGEATRFLQALLHYLTSNAAL